MTYLFISHSSTDRAIAYMLAERLKAKGYSVFLDFSTKYGIPGGTQWERVIMDAIRKSAVVLVCYTPAIVNSHWAFAEVMVARYEGRRVFPLLFSGTPDQIWEILRATTQYIDFTADPERGYERLFDALEQAGYVTTATSTPPIAQDSRPPYAGLQPLQPEDYPFFFARRQDVSHLIERLQPRPGGSRHHLVSIVGPSGSGKSSMVRAGLLPRLRGGAVPGSDKWTYVIFTPGNNPFRRLAEAFRHEIPLLGSVRTIETALLADVQGLDYVVADVLALRSPETYLLLVIDQLEELITKAVDLDNSRRFLNFLLAATGNGNEQNGRLISIATLRADFYSTFLEMHGGAASLLQNTYPLAPLTLDKVREVIEEPARVAQIAFEEGLVDRILGDVGTGDVLPLLSFVLRSMYDSMDRNIRLFTHTLYEQVGGLQGALGLHAERIFQQFPESTGNALIEVILQHLVTITPEGKAARRRARRHDLPSESILGVDKFIEARLFIAAEEEGYPVVEVAHEAIFRNWERLASAIAKESATTQYLRQVLYQGVLDRERLGILLGTEQRQLLNEHRQILALNSRELELVVRSAIRANDQIEYWFSRAWQQGTGIVSLVKDILLAGDPISRHHLLNFLEYLIIEKKRTDLLEIIALVTHSKYPALRRQSSRVLKLFDKNIVQEEMIIPTDFVFIEEGKCAIGPADSKLEIPVDSFEISKYLITNLEYSQFVRMTGHRRPAHWTSDFGFPGKADHPVVYVSFDDAIAYCEWLSSVTGRDYGLPTEAEWEKAASWDPENKKKTVYPWGDVFNSSRCNVRESGIGDTTPVGQYSPHGGDSYYGVSDMAGNVWEWTSTVGRDATGKFIEYPNAGDTLRESLNAWGPRVQRGGTFLAGEEYVRTTYRLINLPDLALQDFGFRAVRKPA